MAIPGDLLLVKEVDFKVEEIRHNHWFFENGKLSKSHDFFGAIDWVMKGLEDEPRDRSFKEYLDSLPNDEKTVRAKRAAARYVEGFHAAEIDRIGVFALKKLSTMQQNKSMVIALFV